MIFSDTYFGCSFLETLFLSFSDICTLEDHENSYLERWEIWDHQKSQRYGTWEGRDIWRYSGSLLCWWQAYEWQVDWLWYESNSTLHLIEQTSNGQNLFVKMPTNERPVLVEAMAHHNTSNPWFMLRRGFSPIDSSLFMMEIFLKRTWH